MRISDWSSDVCSSDLVPYQPYHRYRSCRPVPPAVRAGDAVSAIVRHAISAANPALHEGPSPRTLAFPAPAPWLEALLTGVPTPKQLHLHPQGLRRSQKNTGWCLAHTRYRAIQAPSTHTDYTHT